MKKIRLLPLILMSTLCSCSDDPDKLIRGTWNLESVSRTRNSEGCQDDFVSGQITFKRNGSGNMTEDNSHCFDQIALTGKLSKFNWATDDDGEIFIERETNSAGNHTVLSVTKDELVIRYHYFGVAHPAPALSIEVIRTYSKD